MQLFTPEEEKAIAERAMLILDWNCDTKENDLYNLACHVLETKGVENHTLEHDWIYRFMQRNSECDDAFKQPLHVIDPMQ